MLPVNNSRRAVWNLYSLDDPPRELTKHQENGRFGA
jgi:hypothetical protein